MENEQLINKQYYTLQRDKISTKKTSFIYEEVARRINESLDNLKIKINDCLEIGYQNKILYDYIYKNNKNSNFYTIDISLKKLLLSKSKSYKINLDIDNWGLGKNLYDIIVSNSYIHLCDNFDNLFKNINNSLKPNGFFIASIPGKNSQYELKNSMINADLQIYKGVHNRFIENYEISKISKLLKKNNFMIPVIDIDTIQLRYNNFNDLMEDTRNLGLSNISKLRKKKFEKKFYFKVVEEYYWKNYSKNNQLISQVEIIYLTGWKHDNT